MHLFTCHRSHKSSNLFICFFLFQSLGGEVWRFFFLFFSIFLLWFCLLSIFMHLFICLLLFLFVCVAVFSTCCLINKSFLRISYAHVRNSMHFYTTVTTPLTNFRSCKQPGNLQFPSCISVHAFLPPAHELGIF